MKPGDHVVCGDTLLTKKPHPAGILSCLEQLGAGRQRAAACGTGSASACTAPKVTTSTAPA